MLTIYEMLGSNPGEVVVVEGNSSPCSVDLIELVSVEPRQAADFPNHQARLLYDPISSDKFTSSRA
jgi:hypothetical protein